MHCHSSSRRAAVIVCLRTVMQTGMALSAIEALLVGSFSTEIIRSRGLQGLRNVQLAPQAKLTRYRVGAIWQKAADILGWYNAATPDGTASAVPNCVCRGRLRRHKYAKMLKRDAES